MVLNLIAKILYEEKQMQWRKLAFFFGLIFYLFLNLIFGIQPYDQNKEQGRSAVELIKKTFDEQGPEAAREKFKQLLADRDIYVFEEKEFLSLGNEYLEAKKPLEAEVIFAMAVEIFPDSISALRLLAHSYYISGAEEKSLEAAEKMMSVRGKIELADFMNKNRDSLAETAEEVINRCLEATGGREAWEAVNTMVVVFSVQSTSGEQYQIERMYKRPFLYRQGLQGESDFTATDGTTCWRVNRGQWTEIPNLNISQASMDNWLLNYEAVGISYAFIGLDYFNGSPVYHLKRIFQDSFVEDLYFSALSNLLTEIRSDYVQNQPFMKSFRSLWNYRSVEGVKIPFIFIRNMGSLEPPHGGVVEEVRINVPLNDSLFLPPDYKK